MTWNPEAEAALYRLALTAACMAHDLTAEEATEVHQRLAGKHYAESIEGVYRQVEGAIEEVKAMRHTPDGVT